MMKTTVVIDEHKLKRIMKLTGIRTRRKAIDFALDQAERVAQVMGVFEGEFFIESKGPLVDAQYNLKRVRGYDRPTVKRGRSH